MKNLKLTFAATMFLISSAQSALVITIENVGSDVKFSASGSVNLSGLTYWFTYSPESEIGSNWFLHNGNGMDLYYYLNGPSILSEGFLPYLTSSYVTAHEGDSFGVQWTDGNQLLWVPAGYTSADPISGSMTFGNQSIESLKLIPGDYVYSWGGDDTVTISVESISAVPEPSALLGLAMITVGTASFQRNRRHG